MKPFYFEDYRREPGYFDRLSRQLKSYGILNTSTQILDIGCGRGDFLLSLKRQYKNGLFYGLTISRREAEVIKQSRKFIRLKRGDQLKIRQFYQRIKFDLVINFHTLSYLRQSDQLRMVRLMNECLSPGGILIVGSFDSWIRKQSAPKEVTPEYIQYFYSPTLYYYLANHFRLLTAIKDSRHGYRIHIWQKRRPFPGQSLLIQLYVWINLAKNYLLN